MLWTFFHGCLYSRIFMHTSRSIRLLIGVMSNVILSSGCRYSTCSNVMYGLCRGNDTIWNCISLPFSLKLERLNNFRFFSGLERPVVEDIICCRRDEGTLVTNKLHVEDGTAVRVMAHVAVNTGAAQTNKI